MCSNGSGTYCACIENEVRSLNIPFYIYLSFQSALFHLWKVCHFVLNPLVRCLGSTCIWFDIAVYCMHIWQSACLVLPILIQLTIKISVIDVATVLEMWLSHKYDVLGRGFGCNKHFMPDLFAYTSDTRDSGYPLSPLLQIDCTLMWHNACKFGPLKLGPHQLSTHRDPDFEREAQSVQYVYVLCALNTHKSTC